MPIQKPLVRILGRTSEIPATDRVAGAGIIWVGTTSTESSSLTEYVGSGVPDQDGIVFFNLTTDGTASGPAIFSSILNVQVSAEFPATDAVNLKKTITAYLHNISTNLKVAETRIRENNSALANSGKVYIRIIGIV